MNILKHVLSFFDKESSPLLKPLQIDQSAIERIQMQIASRPKNIKSSFQIELVFKPNRVDYRVGFVESKEQNLLFSYPVPLQMNKSDEEYLQNCTLEYDSSTGNFLLYPDVLVTAEDTPSKNIIKFNINKNIIFSSSHLKEIALDRMKLKENADISLFQNLLKFDHILSIFIKKNSISVEFNNSENIEEKESKTADTILKYFTDFGYPLFLTENKIKTQIPNSK
jgi:hypothetical protein